MRPALALLLAASACAQAPRGWDAYQVIMWSTGSPRDFNQWVERMREAGFTAEECTAGRDPSPYDRAGFGYYVENLVPELGFLNNRKPIYDADFQGYTAAATRGDKSFLVRKPSLDDPEFQDAAKTRLQGLVRPHTAGTPLLYQLRDELSVGSFASPMDYCFSPHTLREFREWLKAAYGSIEALNEEWETGFASWDDVLPMTTWEAKTRERAALAEGRLENYAPWADHRAYMDVQFSRAIDRFRGHIRELDVFTPTGIEGTQMPSAWGGFDLWRLSQAIDWIEPYDIAGSREIFRSFMPQGAPILSTVFGSDFNGIRRKLWWLLLHGDRGAIVWDDDTDRAILKSQEDQPLTDRGRGLAQVFAEIKAAAPSVINLRRVTDPVAIHYSQASIRAHWMFDSREDRDTWPRRFSSYEATHSRLARVRDSFMRVVEDAGLQYNFVSYEQIENSALADYKVLILPQSVAMSAREVRAIDEFVRNGGTVIADNMTATMDEHCRRLPRGQLDDLFGIERKSVGWRRYDPAAAEGFEDLTVVSGTVQTTTAAGVPVIIENRVGDGRAIYLNMAVHDYGKHRLEPPRGDAFRTLIARLLADSGLSAPVRVVDPDTGDPVPCVEVWRYQGDDGRYVAVMRNPEFAAASLKSAVGYPDNSAIENTARVRVLLGGEYKLTDLRAGSPLDAAEHVDMDLDPWSPIILKLEE